VLSLVKGATVFINYLGGYMFYGLLFTYFCRYKFFQLPRMFALLCSDAPCGFFDKNTRAHEVSTSKQHKSISASDVFKALELIEFADLIPPLQAELQGTLRALYLHRSHVSQTLPRLLTAYPIHSCFSLPRASQEQKSIVWGGRVL
jgi:hypothetical protein